jgi:tRNA(Ile)-lysidine synthetase-like protein
LAETAEIARGEEEYWATEIARLLPSIWDGESLNCSRIEAFPLAVRRRLVRAAAESLLLALEFQHVQEVLELKGSVSLPGGWRARRDGNGITFHKEMITSSDYAYALSVPGKVEIPELRLAIEAVLANEGDGPDDLLESSFAKRELVVRNWQMGERFWPVHTKEPRKIKEILQGRHVTGDQKKSWPVIASGGEVVWMRGFGVRRDFRAKANRGVLIRESTLERN